MKSIVKTVLLIITVPLILALALALLFLMPAEFFVSSWHLARVTAKTEGVIDRAEVQASSKGSRSFIEYSYVVDGTRYRSTRHEAGFLQGGYQAGGGEFARSHPTGSKVVVHYDPEQPSFSLLDYGWPTWSVGFPLCILGFCVTGWLRPDSIRSHSRCVYYALTRAMAPAGFLTILFLESTIAPQELLWVMAFYSGMFVVFLGYAEWKILSAVKHPLLK